MVERNIESSRVLIVDDDPAFGEVFIDTFRSIGIRKENIFYAPTIAQARRHLASSEVDFALINLLLGDGHGLTLVQEMRGLKVQIAVVTGMSADVSRNCFESGAAAYIRKPFDLSEFIDCVSGILRGGEYQRII